MKTNVRTILRYKLALKPFIKSLKFVIVAELRKTPIPFTSLVIIPCEFKWDKIHQGTSLSRLSG